MLAHVTPHSNFTPEDLHHFHRAISGSLEVLSHMDLLIWLQGDMQRYLPHDLLIVAWGDFGKGPLHHDVISAIPGVRSFNADTQYVNALMSRLHGQWVANGRRPTCLNHADSTLLSQGSDQKTALGLSLQKMHSALVHGMADRRCPARS